MLLYKTEKNTSGHLSTDIHHFRVVQNLHFMKLEMYTHNSEQKHIKITLRKQQTS